MTFGQPVFISVGDEYDKKQSGVPDRFKGRSFVTNPGRKGAGADTLFGKKFLSMAEGDKYVDPSYFDKRYRLENEKKKLTPQGFRYTNGPKSMAGSGTYNGTFAEKQPWKHEVEFAVTKRGEMPDKAKPALRNIVTQPAKKGHYGTPGLALGTDSGSKYVSDPYEGEKRKEALSAKENSKKIVGPAFKAACKRGGFFDESNHGVSKVYSIDKALPAKKADTDEKHHTAPTAWKPGGRLTNDITKRPEYMEDPYEAKEKKMREDRRAERPKTSWKPIGGTKSLPTRSIKFTPA